MLKDLSIKIFQFKHRLYSRFRKLYQVLPKCSFLFIRLGLPVIHYHLISGWVDAFPNLIPISNSRSQKYHPFWTQNYVFTEHQKDCLWLLCKTSSFFILKGSLWKYNAEVCSVRLVVGLDDLEGLYQTIWSHDSKTEKITAWQLFSGRFFPWVGLRLNLQNRSFSLLIALSF